MTQTEATVQPLILSEEALENLGISSAEVVKAVEQAVKGEVEGSVWASPKSVLLPGDGRYMMTTLSASDNPRLSVVKYVMVSPRNPERGMPGIDGTIMVHDSETAQLLAVMGARWVTSVRTAALSGIAALRLANPESRRIAFIGCGEQARSHLRMFSEIFPLSEMVVFGRGRSNVDRLCELGHELGLKTEVAERPEEALHDADIVVSSVTVAFDLVPFLDANWMKPGAFAAVTDLAVPWKQPSLAAFDTIYIDDLEQEAVSEKRMVDPALVTGDLKQLVQLSPQSAFDPGRRSAFIFRGLSIGDFAAACLAYERATVGTVA